MSSAIRPDGKFAYAPSTIVRRAVSNNAQHVAAGVAPPGADGRVALALKPIKRTRSTVQRRVAPLLTNDMRLLLKIERLSAHIRPQMRRLLVMHKRHGTLF